ncbi:MAG TPA: hypothetical protein VI160_11890 [Gemmatimonadales bacterium]
MHRAAGLTVLLSMLVASAAAQTAIFVEGGALTAPGFSEFQAGLRGSPATLNGTGLDFAAATLPAHFSDGVVLVVADLDASIHRPLSSAAAVAVRLGGTGAFGAGSGGGGAAFGINAGGGLIFSVGPRLLFRLDFTHRWFLSNGTTFGFNSVTFGIGVGG